MPFTTPGAIRDAFIARIAALSPSIESRTRYVSWREDGDFRTWAIGAAASCLRRFAVEVAGDTAPPSVSSTLYERVSETMTIVIAYPDTLRQGGRKGLDDIIVRQRRAIASKQIEIDYLKAGVTAALNAKPAPTSDELKVGDKVDVLDTNGIWNAGNRFVTKVDCGRVDTELQSSAGQGFPWSWERSQVRKAKEA